MVKTVEVQLVFENHDFALVNKPAGMVVNRAQTTKNLFTLQDWIKSYFRDKTLPWSMRMGLVHRLDKDTCGYLIIAKTKTSYLHFLKLFKDRLVTKKYFALIHGKLTPPQGNIHLPIKRDPRNRKKFTVFVGGRMSYTKYQVLDYYLDPKEKNRSKKHYSLVDINLKTGRTHQIRVHFSHLHHPVVADKIYGGKKTSRQDLAWCPHLFLQSYYLAFTDHTGKNYQFKQDLMPELAQAINLKLIKQKI